MSKKCFICCNQCFESNADIQQKFYITNCYHVFCAGCLGNKSACILCSKKCKILPIDANLPKEVKIYFDPNAYQQHMQTMAKIQDFQQTQVKNYVQKQYSHRKTYYGVKQKLTQMMNYKKQLIESVKREKAIMDKLKEAYRSNVITPELFQMRSPLGGTSQGPRPSQFNETEMSVDKTPASTIFFNDKGSNRMETSSNLSLSNFNRDLRINETQPNQLSSTELIRNARKGLIAHTIRDIKQVSQNNSQTRSSQFRKQ